MKIITVKKQNILKMLALVVFAIVLCKYTTSFGMQHYYKVDFSTGLVTATTLNVRSGPGTKYNVIATVKKNEYIRVFAGVREWYIVQVANTGTNTSTGGQSTTTAMNSDEKEVFDLINKQRTNNGLSALKEDAEVQKVARIKAQDMVSNNYFAHESPTYGTPFQMLKNFNISYKTAGENIAANSSNSSAVTAWMNSSGHKANILNSNFNYTGIGVVSSNKYGKIYVQMFIGK